MYCTRFNSTNTTHDDNYSRLLKSNNPSFAIQIIIEYKTKTRTVHNGITADMECVLSIVQTSQFDDQL